MRHPVRPGERSSRQTSRDGRARISSANSVKCRVGQAKNNPRRSWRHSEERDDLDHRYRFDADVQGPRRFHGDAVWRGASFQWIGAAQNARHWPERVKGTIALDGTPQLALSEDDVNTLVQPGSEAARMAYQALRVPNVALYIACPSPAGGAVQATATITITSTPPHASTGEWRYRISGILVSGAISTTGKTRSPRRLRRDQCAS